MIMCEIENVGINDLKDIVEQMAETDLLVIKLQEDKRNNEE